MILTFELDLDMVRMNQHTENLGHRSFSSKNYSPDTQTYTHTEPIALFRPLVVGTF